MKEIDAGLEALEECKLAIKDARAALAGLRSLTAKQGEQEAWVPVSKRLPETNELCLVYWGEAFGQPLLGIAQRCVPYKGDLLWRGHGGSHNEVTHWMPLPPAPGATHPAPEAKHESVASPPEMQDVIQSQLYEIAALEEKVAELRNLNHPAPVNQQLLEALKGLLALDEEHHQRYPGDEDVCQEVRAARAAIAEVEASRG